MVWSRGSFPGGSDGGMPGGFGGFGEFSYDGEIKQVDIANAHISVEIEGGKVSGSMEDMKTGVFVTITMNGKGEVTNVLVSSSGWGGSGRIFGRNNQ